MLQFTEICLPKVAKIVAMIQYFHQRCQQKNSHVLRIKVTDVVLDSNASHFMREESLIATLRGKVSRCALV